MAEKAHKETLGAVGVVLVLVVVHFRDAVIRGRTFFHRDVHLMWYSHAETFVRGLAAGEWPLWNPTIGFGQPLWADANAQILYPITWLHLLIRPRTLYTVYVVLHFAIAGSGFFLLARRLSASPVAALAGAATWVASGPLMSTTEIWNQLAGACWLPWACLAAGLTMETGRVRPAVAWGACHALQVLAGSPEGALMAAATIAAYAAVERPWRDFHVSSRRALGLAAMAAVIAIGLSAGQWLPSIDVAGRSSRPALPPEVRTHWSVHPLILAQTLVPVPVDRLILRPESSQRLLDDRPPLLPSLYLGAPLAVLAAAGLLTGRRRPRVLLTIGLALAVVVALGRHTPLFYWIDPLIPPLRALRYPVKVMPLVALLWAALVVRGIDAHRGGSASRGWPRWPLLAGIVALSVNAGLAVLLIADPEWAAPWVGGPDTSVHAALAGTPLRLGIAAAAGALVAAIVGASRRGDGAARSRASAAAAAIGVLELLVLHDGLSPFAPTTLFTIRPPALDLASPPVEGRLYAYDYFVPGKSRQYLGRDRPYAISRAPVGWEVPAATALAMRLALFPPSAGVWRVSASFDRDTPGLAPRELAHLNDLLIASEGTPAHLRLLQAGAVSRVAALHTDGFEALEPLGARDALLREPVHVFAVPRPRPRAYVVGAVRMATPAEAVRLLLDPGVDIEREAIVTSFPGASLSVAASPIAPEGWAKVAHIGTDRITVDVEASAPGYLVLVEAYDPSWRASVGGVNVPVLRANVAFMAVPIEGGRRRVEFSYESRTVRWGLTISAATIVLMAAMLVPPRGGPAVSSTSRGQ